MNESRKRVKTVIVDLDRTLLRTDKTISSYTVKVLNWCKKKSVKVMIATARPLRDVIQFQKMIGFDGMTVSNGARVICTETKKEYGICQKSAEHILNLINHHPDVRITVETGDCAYSNKPIEDYETVICDDLVYIVNREGVLKILVHIDKEEILSLAENVIPEDLYYTVAHGYLMQIMNRSATKWNGIKEMLNISGCSTEEAVYFGDDNDDIEPIKMCGIGVAVSNALDEVKAVADYVTDSNDEDGVARFIEQYILSKH